MLVGQYVNSVSARVQSIHYFKMNAVALDQVATPLPSTPGLDAVAIADVDGDGCNDIVGAGAYGRGMIHLGNGAGGFDGGQDLAQLGYQNPAWATRVTLAVEDLTGDGRPELVIADNGAHAVMIYRNTSTPAGAAVLRTPRRSPTTTSRWSWRTPRPPRSTCAPTTAIPTAARSS